MLKRFNEARETMSKDGIGDGDGYPGMPPTWNNSYAELENCLTWLRVERPKQYSHVLHRYIKTESVFLEVEFHKGKAKLKPHHELAAGAAISGQKKTRVRCLRWATWVKLQEVDKGVKSISDRFRGEPFLPKEFQEAA